jgi:5-methylcytosine-specific restriction endonuclease McrA
MFREESIGDPNKRAGRGAWKRLAAIVRRRDDNKCRRCGRGREDQERAFPVDHVIPWRNFENKSQADDPENLVTLCPQCHAWKTAHAERRWLQGDGIAFEQYRRAIGIGG